MFVKSVLIVSFIGLAAACNLQDFQDKCQKYQNQMQALSQGDTPPDFGKLCCLLNLQVTCINDAGCAQTLGQTMQPIKAQIKQMCGTYKYDAGCLESNSAPEPASEPAPSGGAEPEGKPEEKAGEDSGAAALIPSLLATIATISALFRIYH